MRFPRAAGVLLHPTCLPGPGGIGSLGPPALSFLDKLSRAGQRVWQVLPLSPTGYGNSPYQALSSFGGSPFLVSGEWLVRDGLLPKGAVDGAATNLVDFAALETAQTRRLSDAHVAFVGGAGPQEMREDYDSFCESAGAWLDELALFLSIREARQGLPWTEWPKGLARREPAALTRARKELAGAIDRQRFVQFLFARHWRAVRDHAAELQIEILGDVPIFVAHDSVDVWANRELFELDEAGQPTAVAGVPPDYFSATGQRWGNPLYRWDVHRERKFDWWISRIRAALDQCDRIRIDHFRAFADYWEIDAACETAIDGRWVEGPGAEFFEAVQAELGELPIVAEDLGDLGDAAFALRDQFDLPGMRVLQFGFGEDPKQDGHSPHSFCSNCVAYTGTHDNDTIVGWFRSSDGDTRDDDERDAQRGRVLAYLGTDGSEIHWDLIRLLLQSVADTAIVPLQDILGLGADARLNRPGVPDGNWTWRLEEGAWTDELVDRLGALTRTYGRWAP